MLLALVGAFAAFVIVIATRDVRARAHRSEAASLARDTTIIREGRTDAVVRRALLPSNARQATSPAELRARVSNLSPGTYIGDILAAQDSALYRWPDRVRDMLRIYVEPQSSIAGWSAQYPVVAQNVFSEWSEAGFPLRFTYIYDSTSADITINWIDRFAPEEGRRIGVTDRAQTSAYDIVKARIRIAMHDSLGRQLSATTVGGVIRHEVGHALGLNHASDPTSVMYHESATSAISQSDRATLRVLYLVTGGSLR